MNKISFAYPNKHSIELYVGDTVTSHLTPNSMTVESIDIEFRLDFNSNITKAFISINDYQAAEVQEFIDNLITINDKAIYMNYIPLRIKQSTTVTLSAGDTSFSTTIDLTALSTGCVGVMLVFEDEQLALNYAKSAAMLEISEEFK